MFEQLKNFAYMFTYITVAFFSISMIARMIALKIDKTQAIFKYVFYFALYFILSFFPIILEILIPHGNINHILASYGYGLIYFGLLNILITNLYKNNSLHINRFIVIGIYTIVTLVTVFFLPNILIYSFFNLFCLGNIIYIFYANKTFNYKFFLLIFSSMFIINIFGIFRYASLLDPNIYALINAILTFFIGFNFLFITFNYVKSIIKKK